MIKNIKIKLDIDRHKSQTGKNKLLKFTKTGDMKYYISPEQGGYCITPATLRKITSLWSGCYDKTRKGYQFPGFFLLLSKISLSMYVAKHAIIQDDMLKCAILLRIKQMEIKDGSTIECHNVTQNTIFCK